MRQPLVPTRKLVLAVSTSALLAGAACGGNSNAPSNGGQPNGGQPNGGQPNGGQLTQISTRFVVPGVTNTSAGSITPTAGGLGPRAVGDFSVNRASDLLSLQYYITRITLCANITVQGSGYNNTTGCSDVYGATSSDNAYDAYRIENAQADTSDAWVDLMSASSIARVAATPAQLSAGDYSYVLVENRKPIKMNVGIDLANSTRLRTCAGGTVDTTGSDTSLLQVVTVPDMTNCTQSLITVGSIGGGNWFKLAQPIRIEAGRSYALDLGFDPDSAITASISPDGPLGPGGYRDLANRVIQVPKIAIAPVVRSASTERTVREQYELSEIQGVSGKVRVNLYFAGSTADVGTGRIQSVEVRFLNDATADAPTMVEKAYEIEQSPAGITLRNYEGKTIVSNLRRGAPANANARTVATVGLDTFFTAGAAGGPPRAGSASATVTFRGAIEL
jgi:hypothetical protein